VQPLDALSADKWQGDVRLSDPEPLFTCQVCGQRGADVRPNFSWVPGSRMCDDVSVRSDCSAMVLQSRGFGRLAAGAARSGVAAEA